MSVICRGSNPRGAIGKTLVFASWKGIKFCRAYVIPGNPNTAEQQIVRGYFATAIAAWKQETNTVKTAWNTYVTLNSLQMTGMNLYVRAYTRFLSGHNGTVPTSTATPPNMS